MAFFGIFILAWVALLIFIIIIGLLVLVFLPCLVLSIVALVNGIRHRWPIWCRILLSVTGTIVTVFLFFIIWYLVWRFAIYVPPAYEKDCSSEAVKAVYYLINK